MDDLYDSIRLFRKSGTTSLSSLVYITTKKQGTKMVGTQQKCERNDTTAVRCRRLVNRFLYGNQSVSCWLIIKCILRVNPWCFDPDEAASSIACMCPRRPSSSVVHYPFQPALPFHTWRDVFLAQLYRLRQRRTLSMRATQELMRWYILGSEIDLPVKKRAL